MINKNVLLLETVTEEADALLIENSNLFRSKDPYAGGEIAANHSIHAIVTRGKGDVSAELIDQCQELEVIARCGVGLDNIDVDHATQKGIKVVNAPGSNADTVAEHALSLMLMLQRQLFPSISAVKAQNWDFRKNYQGDEIRGKTLGVLGMGNIGQKVARLAKAFGMDIIFWDAFQPEVPYNQLPLDEVLQKADIISIHLPLTPKTQNLINSNTLKLVRRHCLIVNTARGGIIDQKALVKALGNGQLGGFAADVLNVEPPLPSDRFLQLPNVLVTPHNASLTKRTYNEMCVLTVQNTIQVLSGNPIDTRYIFNHKAL